jgi:uncharacterized protein YndB with AHSA1/START domain
MQFSIETKAPPEKVWQVLWEDVTYRDWGGAAIDLSLGK